MKRIFNFFILIIFSFFLFLPTSTVKADFLNQQVSFFVDPDFSKNDVNKVSATLKGNYNNLYFYFEDDWWNSKKNEEYSKIFLAMDSLALEFDTNIYPKLTSTFGSEISPGIDNDKKITILFYSTKDVVKGYVNNIDSYGFYVNPKSNGREMIYMNVDNIFSPFVNEYLAHEFMHLITLNQKEIKNNLVEDTWLSEAYSEYAISFLGYNNKTNSYLDRRINEFLNNPSDSITEWKNDISDYGSINIFINYLVDQYGQNLLIEAFKNKKTGIESINDALIKLGSKDSFENIFNNWTVAVYLNDCSVSSKYCFKDDKLKELRVIPFSNFLSLFGENSLFLNQVLDNYSAHWQKFSGGNKILKIKFKKDTKDKFYVNYIIKNSSGAIEVGKITINSNGEGEIIINNIDKINYFVLIPAALNNSSDAYYSITVSTGQSEKNINPNQEIGLPFEINKPLSQMNREELLGVLLRLIIYLLLQGKLII